MDDAEIYAIRDRLDELNRWDEILPTGTCIGKREALENFTEHARSDVSRLLDMIEKLQSENDPLNENLVDEVRQQKRDEVTEELRELLLKEGVLSFKGPKCSELESENKQLREVLEVVAKCENNEATAYPYWLIVSRTRNGGDAVLAGPFFSRDSAEEHRKAREYDYGPGSYVFCCSAHRSEDFKVLYDASKNMKSEL